MFVGLLHLRMARPRNQMFVGYAVVEIIHAETRGVAVGVIYRPPGTYVDVGWRWHITVACKRRVHFHRRSYVTIHLTIL